MISVGSLSLISCAAKYNLMSADSLGCLTVQ